MTTIITIRFEAPAPLVLRRSESLLEFAAALRERPAEWALFGRYATAGTARQGAYEIRRGMREAFRPAGAFEAESRTLCGEHRVYVRYVGGTR